MHYVPFFDLKDAILDMILTVHNALIYKEKKVLNVRSPSVERQTSLINPAIKSTQTLSKGHDFKAIKSLGYVLNESFRTNGASNPLENYG